jgi:hypothetical protein
MNMTGLECKASVIRACGESVAAGWGATARVAPTDAVAGPLIIHPCRGKLKEVRARTAKMVIKERGLAFIAHLLIIPCSFTKALLLKT